MLKLVVEDLARTLPPIGQDAHASFELEVHSVGDAAVRAGARYAKEIASLLAFFERCCQAERNVADFTARDLVGRGRDLPGQLEFFGQDVSGSCRKKGHGHAVTILRAGKAVDDFVYRAVTAAGDDQLAAVGTCAAGDFSGFARTGGFREVGLNTAAAKYAPGFVQLGASRGTAPAGIWVVNQQRVLKILHGIQAAA